MTRTLNDGAVLRRVAGGLLCAVLLSVGTACAQGSATGGSGATGTDADQGRQPTDVEAVLTTLQVCDLADVDLVASTIGTEFTSGPTNVDRGAGKYAAAQQCFGQIDLPDLRISENATPSGMVDAGLYVAVAPYNDTDEATTRYDGLLDEVTGLVPDDQTKRELPGGWDRGVLFSGSNNSSAALVIALAQQESYLITLELSYTTDSVYFDKYPFTREDIEATIEELLDSTHTAVEAELGQA